MTIWRMGISRWIHMATNPQSQYVIVIVCPLQQWLRYTYIVSLVLIALSFLDIFLSPLSRIYTPRMVQ